VNASELNKGEIFLCDITAPDGVTTRTILLSGEISNSNWDDAMAWAKSIGGDLPDLVEQAMLFKCLPEEFQKRGYWSCYQHVIDSGFAWGQGFGNGAQDFYHKRNKFHARAVRRIILRCES
jgi:hypothetical protein